MHRFSRGPATLQGQDQTDYSCSALSYHFLFLLAS